MNTSRNLYRGSLEWQNKPLDLEKFYPDSDFTIMQVPLLRPKNKWEAPDLKTFLGLIKLSSRWALFIRISSKIISIGLR